MARARLPTPMAPNTIRLLGATAPFKPRTEPGTMAGSTAAARPRCRKIRRLIAGKGCGFMDIGWVVRQRMLRLPVSQAPRQMQTGSIAGSRLIIGSGSG